MDDQRLFADAVAELLRRHDRVEVIGVATTVAEGIDLAVGEAADVVLMDISMPTTDGLEGTRRLRSLRPATEIVILSGSDGPELRERASDAGARAFLLKGNVQDELVDVIASVSPR